METITLEVSITKYEEQDNVVFYTISLFHKTYRNSWHVDRRYSEFNSLHDSLTEQFLDIPSLPGKTFWKKFTSSFLEYRKEKLNEFLQFLVSRQDVLQAREFRDFFQLEKNIPNSIKNLPDLIGSFKLFTIPISIYSSSNITFLATVQVPKLDYIRSAILEKQFSTVTCLEDQKELWRISIESKITCMCWSRELTILILGLDNGGLSAYRIKTELEYKEYEEFSFLNPHQSAVIGVWLDYMTSNIYSCGQDRKVAKLNLLREVILQEYILDSPPLSFFVDTNKQKVYILNKKTGLLVLNSETFLPCMSISGSGMCSLCVTPNEIVFVGNSTGIVTVHRDSVVVNSFLLKSKVICISYSSVRKEVYVGNSAGFISIWNRTGKLVHIWKAHETGISCLEVSDTLLKSGGFDYHYKVWKLPRYWIDPEFEKAETFEAEVQTKTLQVLSTQKKLEIDDLAGWDKS